MAEYHEGPIYVEEPTVRVMKEAPVTLTHSQGSVVYQPTYTERTWLEPPRSYIEPGPPPATFFVHEQPFQETLIARKVDIVEHERVVRALERRIVDMEERLSSTVRAASERESQRAQTEAVLQEKCRILEERVNATSGLQSSLDTLMRENKRLETHIQDLDAQNKDAVRLRKEVAQVTEKCTRLANESRQIDGELQASLRARDQLLHERETMAHELAMMEKELMQGAAGVRAVKSQMQARISELEGELQDLISTLRARDAEVRELTLLLQEKDRVLADFDRLKADNIALMRELERGSDDVRNLAPARPLLGVEIKMLDDAAGNPDCVVVVHTITPGGPAEVAGIRPGDILKEWDGILLDSKAKFQRLLDQSPPGTRVLLTIVRGKTVMDVPVTVGAASSGHLRTVRRVKSENQVDNVIQESRLRGTTGRSGQYYPYD